MSNQSDFSLIVEHFHIGKLHVTYHALRRFHERASGDFTLRLSQSVPFGAQLGTKSLFLRDGDIVFTVEKDEGIHVVTTVLTQELAIANMQSRGMGTTIAVPIKAVTRRTPDLSGIPILAAKHAIEGLGKKARNAAMREVGYNPEGESGTLYRAAFEGASWVLKLQDEKRHAERVKEIRQ